MRPSAPIWHIPPRFNLPHPFRMVGQEELDKIYRPGQTESPNAVELRGFLRKGWGVITLSRVGFDLGGKHAIVYAQLTYCGLCGEETYLYLSRETGTWHIVGRSGTWISLDHRRQHCPLGQRALESRLFRIRSSLFSNPRVGGPFPFRTPTPGEIGQFFNRRIFVDDMVKAN